MLHHAPAVRTPSSNPHRTGTRRRVSRLLQGLGVALLALLLLPTAAMAEEAPTQIDFITELAKAFEKSKAEDKPLMICINSRKVDGGRVERAAGWLRDEIYKDKAVIAKSQEFVCALLTSGGSSGDFGELRARFGIEGLIVSPQHIFVHPDGKTVLVRKEYWPHGGGANGVEAMLGYMKRALEAWKPDNPAPEAEPENPAAEGEAPADQPEVVAPDKADERQAWIDKQIQVVKTTFEEPRWDALMALVRADKDGDCTKPLVELIEEYKKKKDEYERLADIVKALGVDGLMHAALPIAELLGHKDEAVRGMAAVSLEHIGSKEKKVVDALRKKAPREKVVAIANHMFRALGRCGAGDKKVRSVLNKAASSAKDEWATYGPIIALAYFTGDEKASADCEKLLKKLGHPAAIGRGRRGGGRTTMRRYLLGWTIAEIGVERGAEYVDKEILEDIDRYESRWLRTIKTYWQAVASCCRGDASAMDTINAGIGRVLGFMGDTNPFVDAYRTDRSHSGFRPKGEWGDAEGPLGGGGNR